MIRAIYPLLQEFAMYIAFVPATKSCARQKKTSNSQNLFKCEVSLLHKMIIHIFNHALQTIVRSL